ncbi:DEAD/DEAH box helicase [Prolixibacteraceae bacterium JC049]|nr:DEAD/DEAH box helicase [Prolixibacteraceae bacterium JC049]
MKFERYNISPEIKRNIAKLDWKRPTDIQFKSIPPVMKGEDVLAIAQTGTGKTAAFAIPIVDKVIQLKKKGFKDGIKCLVMVPTRELAQQITQVFLQIGKNTRVNTMTVFGGVTQDDQITQLQKGTDILVATPGRMFDLRSQGHIDLGKVKMLVLDEADHMLDLGFIKDIRDVIKYIPKGRQTLFYSATIDEKIKKLAYSLVTNPIRIQISPKDPISRNIEHSVAFVEMDHKRFFLERMVTENPESKILAFVRTKVRAERVQKAMERVNIKSLTIHGDKEQRERQSALATFRKGEVKLLIATDVSARGIDIPNVDYVINYDLPDEPENYVHRIGRTGRGRQKGQALAFCSDAEKPLLHAIHDYIGKSINTLEIGNADYQETLDLSVDAHEDWKTLMRDFEDDAKNKRKKKK